MRVPTYDNLQTDVSTIQAPTVKEGQGPNPGEIASKQMQDLGDATQRAGAGVGAVVKAMQEDANKTRVDDALNTYVTAQTDARVEALSLKGKNALERPDGKSLPEEYGEKLKSLAGNISLTLGNEAQKRAFTTVSQHLDEAFHGALAQHMVAQQAAYRTDTRKATIATAVNQGALLWGDAAMLKQSGDIIAKTVDAMAKDLGWDKVTRDEAMTEAISPMHVGVMQSMIQGGMASQAKAYYEANTAGMTIQARASMQHVIKTASDTQAGESGADAIWAAAGPRTSNEPVKIFDMERDLRAQLKDNPDAMKHGIAALRERASAFNAQQAETNSAGVNAVFALIDKKVPMRDVQRSPEWLALPDVKRHEIVKSLESEAATRESRAAAQESRAAARESRAFTAEQRVFMREQRADVQLLRGNADQYARISDPEVLRNMSREGVIETRTVFGIDGRDHLLNKWDQLQQKGGAAEARMDKEDFQHVAESMGLDPFNAKSPEKKRQLGELQFRVEQLIDVAQRAKKAPLTREEKMQLMTGELAKKVTTRELYGTTNEVPVIQLGAEQAAKVVVPPAERGQIAAEMAKRYAANPTDKRFQPSDANVRYWYLRNQSRAAALIPDAK